MSQYSWSTPDKTASDAVVTGGVERMSNQKEEEKEKEQLCIERDRGVVSLCDSFFQLCYLTIRSISDESINGNPLQFRVKLFHCGTLQVVLILPPK